MKKLLALLLTQQLLQPAQAQVDAHFSQFYAHPLWLNPALSGAFDGSLRVTGIYRSQWSGLMTPFSTAGLAADADLGHNIKLGGSVLHQTAGDAGYQFTNGSLSIAYSGIRLGPEGTHLIQIGVQGGFLNRRFDPARFQFGSQWTPANGFDPTLPANDNLTRNSGAAFDLGAGISWMDAGEDKKANGFAGFSVNHLTQPQDPFIANSSAYLPMRYSVYGGLRVNLSESMSITPHFLYLRQGNAEEQLAGAQARWMVNEGTSLLAGVNYRVDDAVVPMVGLMYNRFTLGLSYDNTISRLSKLAGTANAFELSLSFILPRDETWGIPCPRF